MWREQNKSQLSTLRNILVHGGASVCAWYLEFMRLNDLCCSSQECYVNLLFLPRKRKHTHTHKTPEAQEKCSLTFMSC